ncbi:MAG: hypothetical protein RI935_713 [Candidatus Parcubacteria bacterium]|jgi:hypothetical protein
MQQFEQSARERHGNMMYQLTRRARETEAKWIWFLVFGLATLQLTWVALLLAGMVLSLGWPQFGYGAAALVVVVITLVVQPRFFRSKTVIAVSSYYSVAADIKREGLGGVYRLLYATSGAMSVVLAYAVYFFFKRRMYKVRTTELDVLGSVFSKAKLWRQAGHVYKNIKFRYTERDQIYQGNLQKQMEVAVPFALACKWMLPQDPGSKQTPSHHDQ